MPEALVNSVQCSREARRALKRGVVPLQWICADRTDVERAARLESLFALRPARPARGDAEFNASLKDPARVPLFYSSPNPNFKFF